MLAASLLWDDMVPRFLLGPWARLSGGSLPRGTVVRAGGKVTGFSMHDFTKIDKMLLYVDHICLLSSATFASKIG